MATELDVNARDVENARGRTSDTEPSWPVRESTTRSPQSPSFWKRLFTWETLTVVASGKTVDKGYVVTPTIAAVLLGALIGAAGFAYKSSTADSRQTRDAVIRMETLLNERTRNFEREQDKFATDLKNEQRLGELLRENATKNRLNLLYALRQHGIIVNLE